MELLLVAICAVLSGFYHQAHGRHATLASDLMEPFRHLVERAALSAIQRHELNLQDFHIAADGACLIRSDARRRYLGRLVERFTSPITAYAEDEAMAPLHHMHRQNLSLIGWLDRGEPFCAWRTR